MADVRQCPGPVDDFSTEALEARGLSPQAISEVQSFVGWLEARGRAVDPYLGTFADWRNGGQESGGR